jgi:hypothetical protein
MKRGNKNGLSTIVVTLILIVLSLVAIGIIWGVIRNILKSSSEQIQTGDLTIDLDITQAYEETGKVTVKVMRKVGKGEITKIKFLLSDGGDTEVITNEISSFEELDFESFVLTPVQLIPTTILTVSIAAVSKSNDGIEIVGGILDTYTLTSGSNDNNDNNNNNSLNCIPDCGLRVCGSAPNGCNGANACGICLTGSCSEDGLSCIGCTPLTSCSAENICGTKPNGCGGELNCGTCPNGQLCNSYGTSCDIVHPLNTGIVDDTWPGDSGLYLGSSSLSTDFSYQGSYVKFPESAETRCLLIISYRFPVIGYTKSHIAFNFETLVKSGDSYEIYESFDKCDA